MCSSLWWFAAVACAALLPSSPARANNGLSSTSFSSNELRTGFARLYRTGLEQPFTTPYTLFDPDDYQTPTDPLLQPPFRRPAPFGLSSLAASGFKFPPRPRYEAPRYLSWVIPYYYVPTRFHPGGGGGGRGGGGRKPNDVLVIVVKVNKNCTSGNDTKPADGGGEDDDDDDTTDENDDDEKEGGLNPDDEVETVTVVTGGAEKNKEPSRCVWAILSCCAPANSFIRYSCFDILGCSTAFWNTNPCVPAVIKTVLDQAITYYGGCGGGGGSPNGTTTTTTAEPPTTTTAAAPDGMAALSTGTVTTVAPAPPAAAT